MRGKVARALRRVTDYKISSMRSHRTYKPVAAKHFFRVNEAETEKQGETRLEIARTNYTWFQNNAVRAIYRNAKKLYTLNKEITNERTGTEGIKEEDQQRDSGEQWRSGE